MKGQRVILAIGVALGLTLIVFPMAIMPPCARMLELASGSSVHMRCHWTAVCAAVIGGIAAVSGGALLLKRERMCAAEYAVLLCCGLAAILTASSFIGVCKARTMVCAMGTKPAICVLGAFLMADSAAGMMLSRKRK